MKKFLKSCFAFVLMLTVVFAFSACGPKLSKTTTDTSKVSKTNGVTTNGGITTIYNGYLYFINGTKDNDGKSSSGNTRAGVYRVKINEATGKIDEGTYERVVSDLVGYDNGSLYFFGDFMYYTTPSTEVNKNASVLYYKTKFMRYDLVNKKSYKLYTTKQNSSSESLTYAYYVNGDDLNLVVYESASSLITSLKIGKSTKVNYTINNVTSCVMSENFGQSKTANRSVDANSFVFFTQNPSSTNFGKGNQDKIQTGVKVFRTSPDKNDSYCISSEGKSVSLLCIRHGSLIYSCEETGMIYSHQIIGNNTKDILKFDNNIISTSEYTDSQVLFLENDDGTISLVYYNSKTYMLSIITWSSDSTELSYSPVDINNLTSDFGSVSFIGTVTLTETVVVESDASGDGNQVGGVDNDDGGDDDEEPPVVTTTDEVTYLIFTNSSLVYKIELMRKHEDKTTTYSTYAQPVQLSETKVEETSGLLNAEVVGNYLYIYAKRLDNDGKATNYVYLHRIDITISDLEDLEEDDDRKATLVGVIEKDEDKEEDKK